MAFPSARWHGMPLLVDVPQTHVVSIHGNAGSEVLLPLSLDPGVDLRRTTYLSRMIQRWGRLPLMFLETLNLKEQRYALIGTEDWFMYPLLQPGTFVCIDDTQRKIATSGWSNEFERPIYFLEHRSGYACGWCSLNGDQLILQPHPASLCSPQIYNYPDEIDLIGQVSGIAMRLDQGRRRRTRF